MAPTPESETIVEERPVWGNGVRQLRGIRQMTQVELADAAGTTQVTISRIENGSRQVGDGLRVRIAKALGVDPHALFPYLDEDVPA